MQRRDFHYDLPAELIAHYPAARRSDSRLLTLSTGGDISHRQFSDLPSLLNPKDLLVFNNTKVVPARLFGRKVSGGKIEVLVERVLDQHRCLAHCRASKSPKLGSMIELQRDDQSPPVAQLELLARRDSLFEFACDQPITQVMEDIGHMPLPPYIDRADEAVDAERYQTVFAQQPGAVAAPTAGLHFTQEMLNALEVEQVQVTLHVGAGTFQPVRADDIREHVMHAETIEVTEHVCDRVRACRERGGRVIAVGTTSVRSLESASQTGVIATFKGESQIFIYPGYEFVSVDAMITNFHLPESTLIMLVSAFAGRDHIMSAYEAAINERYRFFSYGDAMFLHSEAVHP